MHVCAIGLAIDIAALYKAALIYFHGAFLTEPNQGAIQREPAISIIHFKGRKVLKYILGVQNTFNGLTTAGTAAMLTDKAANSVTPVEVLNSDIL